MAAESTQFHEAAERLTHDLRHRALIQKALGGYYIKRDEQKEKYTDWQQARAVAASAKYEAVNHLDKYLVELSDRLEARGTKVFWAADGAEAADYICRTVEQLGEQAALIKGVHLSCSLSGEYQKKG